jgi:hypothetical protein
MASSFIGSLIIALIIAIKLFANPRFKTKKNVRRFGVVSLLAGLVLFAFYFLLGFSIFSGWEISGMAFWLMWSLSFIFSVLCYMGLLFLTKAAKMK